ncbi:hypothetical protein K3555_21210 (plasmid) [Leisingera sp. M527]|uniref:hypothetical protein n=1 Tax=Leisingera sp. M527 TaxID=2867014 RepID=UPI0021A6AB9B|nr:hypothetical protein [Leisingera sp. M527]UWQ35181.1 hypothetical protein K3555_21210 [Leisingera sp. M527]
MPRKLTPPPHSAATAGLTLIELAIAIFVLAAASIALLRSTDQSRLAIGGEAPRLLARIAARNRAEELQLPGAAAPLPGQTKLGGMVFTLQTRRETTAAGLVKTEITARAESGEAAALTLYLPAAGLR